MKKYHELKEILVRLTSQLQKKSAEISVLKSRIKELEANATKQA